MISCLAWVSDEQSPRLNALEVEKLFTSLFQLAELGVLNGKFQNASQPLYWQRLRKGE